MKAIKIISTLLAVLMLVSALPLVIAAEEVKKEEYTYLTDNKSPMMPTGSKKIGADVYSYKTGEYVKDGKTYVVETAEDKLALMDYRYGNDRYALYVDAYSGEVAIVDKETGESMFTNPYNIGVTKANEEINSTKDQLLSQLIINYTEITTDMEGKYYSYTWAANRGQISVKSIKSGIRVEYAIGRVESRTLLPRMLSKERGDAFFATIYANAEAEFLKTNPGEKFKNSELKDELDNRLKIYYNEVSLKDIDIPSLRDAMLEMYPALEKYDLYVLDEASLVAESEIKRMEGYIRSYHPEYSFEDMDEAHQEVSYEAATENVPLFRMALEYTVDDKGLVVRLPANSIRFDETLYRLNYIQILPYMGAGSNPNSGYTFFPDGSGATFDFETIAMTGMSQGITGKVYGDDFAYHEISSRYEEAIRYPVYGLVETENLIKTVHDETEGELKLPYQKDRGFVAIVEEGDSLLEIRSDHGGQEHVYNSMILSARPRPTDQYYLDDAERPWTVVSARKYTGSYQIRYIMLTDVDTAKERHIEDYYDCSYVGMAKAYRDYLEENGTLTRLNDEDVKDDIPLYIETFGALMTTERFLSIPFNVMTPLTSFGDIATMYDELKEEEISNVNFIMTGYSKGGLTNATIPYNLKWDRSVSKDMEFDELLNKAKDEGFGLFPDFDIVFAANNTLFDGLTLKKHAVKTIDNRYTSKREYSATKHTHVSYFELAISPAYFDRFYEKFVPKYQKFEPIGISVSTLGSYLNSDFDEDEPYNRDDSKQYTIKAFQYIREQFADAEVMTSGGNAYCWKYVDHITDIALDSSRYSLSSASVPFLGIVLHGYVELSGSAANMEGNLDYAFLKSLESGAALKFILSYRNTENLKEYETLSKYYSVRYDIWFSDVVSMYHELNGLLKDVQTSTIEDHRFLDAVRVPDDDELMADAMQSVADKIALEIAAANAIAEAKRKEIQKAHETILEGTVALKNNNIAASKTAFDALVAEMNALIADAGAKQDAYKLAQEAHADKKADVAVKEQEVEAAKAALDAAPTDPALELAYQNAQDALAAAKSLVEQETTGTRAVRDAAKAEAQTAAQAVSDKLKVVYTAATQLLNEYNGLMNTYNSVVKGMDLLEANAGEIFKSEYMDKLQAMVTDTEFVNAYNALVAADYANPDKADSVMALAKKVGVDVTALQVAVLEDEADTTAEEYATSDVAVLINAESFTYTAPSFGQQSGNGNVGSTIGAASNSDKYVAAENMVVYERYSDGTEFILNFNDYRVSVSFGGMTYTVDAYGYIVLNRGA